MGMNCYTQQYFFFSIFLGSIVEVSKIPFSHIRFANMKFANISPSKVIKKTADSFNIVLFGQKRGILPLNSLMKGLGGKTRSCQYDRQAISQTHDSYNFVRSSRPHDKDGPGGRISHSEGDFHRPTVQHCHHTRQVDRRVCGQGEPCDPEAGHNICEE